MTLINRAHPDIAAAQYGRDAIYMSVTQRRIYFTSFAAHVYGFKAGQFVHFINDNASWMFFVNDDPDGFPLLKDGKKQSNAVFIVNHALVKMIRKSTKFEGNVKLFFHPGTEKKNDIRVFEIVTHKEMKLLLKAI